MRTDSILLFADSILLILQKILVIDNDCVSTFTFELHLEDDDGHGDNSKPI
jgi:hypothetical protein